MPGKVEKFALIYQKPYKKRRTIVYTTQLDLDPVPWVPEWG